MWLDQRGSEVLPRNECLRLLAVRAGGVGRIGLIDRGDVVIEPVNYRFLDGDVLVQVGAGSILDAALDQTIVAFETDTVDMEKGEAWSVLVQGLATAVGDEELIGQALPAGATPLVPEPGTSFVRIRTGVLSGRRFQLHR